MMPSASYNTAARSPSLDADALILDFPASELYGNKFLSSINDPVFLGILFWQSKMD
jgi:hypothetical protein